MTNENLPLSSLPKCNIIAQKDLLNLSSDKRQRIDFEIEQALLLSKASLEEQITALYGSAYNNDHHTIVNTAATTSGIDSHTTATVGVFWGRGNRRNQASRIPGKQTANRAQLYAILLAITDANPCHALHIISPSEYAIHSICHWAPKLARAGWPCANKDILCDLHTRISSFHSHILFSLTNRQSDNPNHRQAITLARNALTIHHSPVTTLPTKTHMCTCVSPELPILKVSTTLRIRSIAETKLIELDVLPSAPSPTDLMKRDHLSALLRSSSDKMFWSAVNKMSIPVPKRSDINAEDLLPIFAERMNPPTILPPTFNSTRRSLNTLLYNSISSSTENPLQSHDAFTRPFSIPEIEQIKAHIIRHNVHSARGPDSVSYEDLLCIPNDTLTDIFNSCIAQQVMPVSWCNAFIAARPKKGSVQNDPNSFRTIGLESCMLKMITLLIDRRLRIWAKEKEIIPPSQNGFQDKLRTINNVFILRCVLDKTRAYNQPLHIVFIDLTNAFPSVHQPTLWIKLRRLGADGPMIRWIQLLYESLRYQVRFQGSFSILFRALAGILIGDPASPFFWIFYMQDLRISSHSDDVILHNTPISHLEQADDIVLFSTSQEAIQGKLQELSIWCSDNGMAINPKKSAHLYFAPRGKRSEDASSLWVDNMELPKTTSYNYLGVSWSTTSTTSFTDHLKEKTKKATNMTNAIFGIESFTDQMPPTALRSLYYARVDPHLTSACEVIIDITSKSWDDLISIQLRFLRRMLRLNPHSSIPVLFTETGILPLRVRRTILALRFLAYACTSPSLYVREALYSSWLLADENLPCWFSDLQQALDIIDITLSPMVPLTKEMCQQLERDIVNNIETALSTQITSSNRLALLSECRKSSQPLINFRKYLTCTPPAFATAIAQLLASDHPFAIERLRRSRSYHSPPTPAMPLLPT